MSLNWKGMFVGLLGRTHEPDSHSVETRSTRNKEIIYEDEEGLVDDVPYKLEPDPDAVEQYLNRIRRQGF